MLRLSRYAAMTGVTLVVVATHASLLLGQVSPIWDALEFFGPYQVLIGDYARSGRLLLWNPLTSFGAPDGIDPQIGAFSPLVLLFGLLFGGSRHGFEWYWLFVWLLGPLGVLRLARHLRIPAWGAYCAAMAWAMSGFYTGHAEHTAWIASVSSLPWILWRLDVSVLHHRWRPAVEAGALWGLSALAGYPGIIFLNFCFAALWTFGRSRRWLSALLPLAAMGGIGLLVLSPAYVSFLVEGRGYSHRAGALPFDVAVESNALHPLAIVTLTNPRLALANVYEYTDISMRSLYVGTVVPVLAAVAIVARRSRFRWLLLGAGLLFLAAALGHSLPVRGWLYDLVLPTRYFRNAAMFRVYLMFALTMLALFGAADIESMMAVDSRRSRRPFIAGAMIAIAALAAYLTATTLVPAWSSPGFVSASQAIVGWGLLLGVCLISVRSFTRLKAVLPMTLVLLATLDAVASAYAMRPVMYGTMSREWRELDAQHVADAGLTQRGLARVVDNGNNFTFAPKIPAAFGYAPLTGPLVREYTSEPVLLDAAVGTDRLWFSPTAASVDRSSVCLAAFRRATVRLGAPPLVIHRRDVMQEVGDTRTTCDADLEHLPAATRVRASVVHVERYTPDGLKMRVHVEQPGWLLVTDSWSRGWTAVVNGRPTEVAGGNFLFRAVRVGAGTNRLDFDYRPFGYPWLLLVSWSTMAVVLIGAVRRRHSAAYSSDAIDRNGATDLNDPNRLLHPAPRPRSQAG